MVDLDDVPVEWGVLVHWGKYPTTINMEVLFIEIRQSQELLEYVVREDAPQNDPQVLADCS